MSVCQVIITCTCHPYEAYRALTSSVKARSVSPSRVMWLSSYKTINFPVKTIAIAITIAVAIAAAVE